MAHFHYQVGDEIKTVKIERVGATLCVTVGDHSYTVVAQRLASSRFALLVDDQRLSAVIATDDQATDRHFYVWLDGDTWTLQRATGQRSRQTTPHQDTTGRVIAPMPGQVLALFVAVGERVALGDPLVVLGAMKMETRLTAPQEGVVQALTCAVGDAVERGQLLVQLVGM